MKRKSLLLAAAAGLAGALAVSAPAFAVLNADTCKKIGETAADVYDLAIKNGMSVKAATDAAETNYKRRVHEESGTTIKSMTDAIDACKAAGLGYAAICRGISSFYTSAPC